MEQHLCVGTDAHNSKNKQTTQLIRLYTFINLGSALHKSDS